MLARIFPRLDCDVFFLNIESRTKLISKLLGVLLPLKEHLGDARLILGLPFKLGDVFVDESQQFFIPFRSKVLGNVNLVKGPITWSGTVSSSPFMVWFFLAVLCCQSAKWDTF